MGGVADDVGRGDIVRRAGPAEDRGAVRWGVVDGAGAAGAAAVWPLPSRRWRCAGWPLRLSAVLVAATSAGMAYLAITPVGDPRRGCAGRASRRSAGGRPGRHPAALHGRGDHGGGRGGHACRRGAAHAVGRQGAIGRGPLRTAHSGRSPTNPAPRCRSGCSGTPSTRDATRPIQTTRAGDRRRCGGGYPSLKINRHHRKGIDDP